MTLKRRSVTARASIVVFGAALGVAGCATKPANRGHRPFPPPEPFALQTALAIDAAGNQVLAGSFRGELTIDGGKLVSAGGTDIFVVKTSPTGAPIFPPQRFGGPGEDAATGVAVDADGSIVIVGTFQAEAHFGEQAIRAEARNPQQRAVFAAGLEPNGKVKWVKQIAASNVPTQVSVAIRPDHAIVVGVSATGTVSSGEGTTKLSGESITLALLSAVGERLPVPGGHEIRALSPPTVCAHSPCHEGGPLQNGCGLYGCVGYICSPTVDPYCCTVEWDDYCVSEMSYCYRRCDCSQVTTTGWPFYPDTSPCTVAIYGEDPTCSDNWWDTTCVGEVSAPGNARVCNPVCQ